MIHHTWLKRLGALSLALSLTALAGCGSGGAASGSGSGSASGSAGTGAVEPMDLTGVTDPYLATAGIPGDTVVARIDGRDITAASVLYWVSASADNTLQYYSMLGMTELPWDNESDGKTLEQAFLDGALETAALYAILPVRAGEQGLELSQEAAQQAASSLESMEAEAGSPELLEHMLWTSALTAPLYTSMFQVGELNGRLQEQLYGQGSAGYPTDAQVLDYAAQQGNYRAKHILLKTVDTDQPLTDEEGNQTGEYQPLDEATVAQKKALAEDLLAQLQAADDKEALFDQLMAQYSEDTAADGSLNGADGYTTTTGQMVAPFEEAALALEPGEISGIVESVYGYHIILRLPLDAADYREDYIADQMSALQQSWLDAAPVESTEELSRIDPSDFYNKMQSLRAAVQAEQEAQAGDQTDSSAAGSQ